MATYKLARAASEDIESLVAYTTKTWGVIQASKYYSGLTKQAQLLAEMPTLGALYAPYEKLRAFPYERHILYFSEESHGITIARVLHQDMNQELHLP
ncbi:MAG: type II toxin-antitoxin system RelE/ParE family toxin [Pseudomonadales bacterium]|nr:type II toxin-antitoxin system RelE/ParE family toxin [Pseudomonadales bacterium]